MSRQAIQDEFTGQRTRHWRWAQRNKKKGNCLHGAHAPELGRKLCRLHLNRLSWAQASLTTREAQAGTLTRDKARNVFHVLNGLGR